MDKIENTQRRPIKAWRVGVCQKCKGATWTTPIVQGVASGFGYLLPTGKVGKRCSVCGYIAIGPAV